MPQPVFVRGSPVLLDQMLAAKFGAVRGRELLAETLDLNPGLAETGPILPVGATILLPDGPATRQVSRPVVNLFGE